MCKKRPTIKKDLKQRVNGQEYFMLITWRESKETHYVHIIRGKGWAISKDILTSRILRIYEGLKIIQLKLPGGGR